jgi:hypothetical protein
MRLKLRRDTGMALRPLTLEVPIAVERVDRHTADNAHGGEHESLGVGIVD